MAFMSNTRKVLAMVLELHRMGYQRLRVAPGLTRLGESGGYWQCDVTPASNVLKRHGARSAERGKFVRYGGGEGTGFVGWTDLADDSPRQLAEKFVARFADLAAAGRGPDKPYADWYAEMMRLTEPSGLVYAYADWQMPADGLPIINFPGTVPMPPPGEASDGPELESSPEDAP
jgi:hypothetical protein